MIRKILALLCLTVFTASCAQKTVFISEPSGARVMVNGDVIGETPCTFQYREGTEKSYTVVVSKENHKPISKQIVADAVDGKTKKRWLTAGLVWSPLWLGTLFTRKLRDSYHFILTKIEKVKNSRFAEKKLVDRLALNKKYNNDHPSNSVL